MKHTLVALLLVGALACTQKPAPVANDTAPADPALRPAIEVLYVGVPSMSIYAHPALDAPVTGSYGLTEAVSILEKKGDWMMIRTFDGTGWVKSADLIDGAQAKAAADNPVPRFYVPPVKVEALVRGEIAYQAKVNTAGEVVEVKLIQNTTGSAKVADDNAKALQSARFYPMIKDGQRQTFVYQHTVYY